MNNFHFHSSEEKNYLRIIKKIALTQMRIFLYWPQSLYFFTIKIMPAKKVVKKTASKAVAGTVEKQVKTFAKTFEKEAKNVSAEGKELGSKIWSRWHVSSTEEKIYTILGILILVRGLYVLRGMIGGMLLIVIGILFVTGFFMRRK